MADDELSGRQLAEILKHLASRVQDNLDSGNDIVAELKQLASKVEENRD
jgi:hypothetical protein